MARRHRRWLSRDALFPLSLSLLLPLPVHAVFSFQVVSSAAISLSADWYPEKGMAVYSPDEGKLPSRERPWATLRWQEDVVRAIALCPNEGPLIFTSDASKWPVRKRARRKRKKRKGKGKRERKKERKKVGEEREKERRRGRDPVKSPRGTRQRFASLYPWSKPFLFSPSRAKRLCLFLPIHSRLLVDRFSFVIPFAAAKENVPAKWERVSPIQCRTCRQRDQLWQIVCVSRDIAKTIF